MIQDGKFFYDIENRLAFADMKECSDNITTYLVTCFCILQNGLKILIAACNTFKSGAIEQLRVYVALGQNSNVDADMEKMLWDSKGLLLITPKQTNLMY
ncbi:unnamed protein product [Rhizophagus irregularis]|nr:unnamed protein product [Rhizophagus irregularis]CAB4434817.1 unnamed protein product [Rhizophagus irregularis]